MDRQWLTGSFAACVFLVAINCASAGKPLPVSADAYTAKNYHQDSLAFARRFFVEEYAKHGTSNNSWDADVAALFDDAIVRAAGMSIPPASRRIENAEKAIAAGCDDPVVYFAYARALGDAGRWDKALPAFEKSLQSIRERGYSGFAKERILRNLIEAHHRLKQPQKAAEYLRQLPDAILEALDDPFIGRAQVREFLRVIGPDIEGLKLDSQKRIIESALKLSNADPWLVRFLAGGYHVDEAWRQRGGSWGSNVAQEAWRQFSAHLSEARKLLTEAYEIENRFPEAPTRMISIAMAEPLKGESTRDWFDRAVAGQLDWIPAYRAYLNSIRPRWRGSYDEMYAFGLECARCPRFDTDVPLEFVAVLIQISNDEGGSYACYTRPECFEMYRHVLDARQKKLEAAGLPDVMVQYWTDYAGIAYKTGRFVEASEALDRLGNKASPDRLRRMGIDPAVVRATARAFNGPFRERIKEAEEKITKSGDLDGAVAIFAAIVSENQDEIAAPIFQGRLDLLRAQADLIAGKKIQLPADERLSGWTVTRGTFEKTSSGVILAKSTNQGAIAFTPVVPGPRFELEATIETPPDKNQAWQCAAIFLADSATKDKYWYAVDWHPKDNLVNFRHPIDPCLYEVRLGSPKTPNKIRIQVWDGLVNVYVDNRLIHAERSIDALSTTTPVIGIGSLTRFENIVTPFSAITLKLLDKKPESEPIRFHRLLDGVYHAADNGDVPNALKLIDDAKTFRDNKEFQSAVEFARKALANRERVKTDATIDVLGAFPDVKDWRGTLEQWKVEDGKLIGTTVKGTIRRELALDLENYELSFHVEWKENSSAKPTIHAIAGLRNARHAIDILHFADSGLFYKLNNPSGLPHEKTGLKSTSAMDIRIRKQGRSFELFHDDQRVAKSQLPYFLYPHGNCSLIVHASEPGETVTFSKIQITPLADE